MDRTYDYLGYRNLGADALQAETWRLPETLAWIRSTTKSFSGSDRDAFVRDARELGRNAFHLDGPRSEDIGVEGRALLDMAAIGEIELYSRTGPVERSLLGPDASIHPRGNMFAIWPRKHVAYDEYIVDVWCKRRVVQHLWPKSVQTIVGAESECRRWLEGLMRKRANARSKKSYQEEASRRFPRLSSRGFGRAWDLAIEATGATAWRRAGRKPKPNPSGTTGAEN